MNAGPVQTFNGPLEVGIRLVSLLGTAYPRTYDLQRLVAFDYLLVHTGDLGGPESLHPPTPLHTAELLIRRGLVERALLLMHTRDLIARLITDGGIEYAAGENATVFLNSLAADYSTSLRARAKWLVALLGDHSDQEFKAVMRKVFDAWVEEFQAVEPSLGSNA
jgi:hypothetical protein